ncbi:MAG TPA: molybdenum ABC transporter ATP-binding protein [Gammaproteobacteria bacterium]|nr:molybdenum ABC transporter ATP-binding protein [Gammaproteobacteria bacterium]
MAELALDVRVTRPAFALEVSETLAVDGITALFGPSGSGKTTLLRTIAGLEESALGTVTFDGERWQHDSGRVPPHRRGVGYVFQDGRLFPHLDVEQNLSFARARAARRPRTTPPIEIGDVVHALDLGTLLRRRPASLSGGEQQRVAIGRALLTSPRLLLMDEPLSSLDVGRKREIVPLIEKLPEAFRVPVLYVTHNVDEVARLASRVVLLSAGRIVAQGGVADILERIDLWTYTGGREAGAVLEVKAESESGGIATLRLREQALQVPMEAPPLGRTLRIRIHARDVAVATVQPRDISIRNVLGAEILRVDLDASVYAELLLGVDGQHLRARITRGALEELALRPGQHVYALIKSVALESTLLG